MKHMDESKSKVEGIDLTKEGLKNVAKQKGLALHAIRTTKHKGVLKMLREQYVLKEDKHPSDLSEAYELLHHYISANNIPEMKIKGKNR